MKPLLLPLSILLLLVISCSGKADLSTPEKFVDSLILSINNKDTAMFNSLFLDGTDYDYLVKEVKRKDPSQNFPVEKAMLLSSIREMSKSSYESLTSELTTISTFQLNRFEINEDDVKSVSGITLEIQTPENHKKQITIRRLILVDKQWKAVAEVGVEETYFN